MKKLLSTITISALVGTSASNLKPVFTNNVVSHGFKSSEENNKDITISGENDTNPFVSKIISKNEVINSSTIAPNGDIYVLSSTGSQGNTTSKLYKSKDGVNFTEIKVFDIFIETLVVAPNGDIYAGTLTKGLWKSPDGGSTFNQVVSDKFDRFAMENLLITSDGTIYVGSFGLYKSTDNGKTFNPINEFNRTSILKLSIVSNRDIYVGTNGKGLWKSTNNGETFDELKEMPNNINIYDVISAPNGDIYVKTYGNGLWKSNDGGIKFSKIIENKITFGSLAIAPNGDIYVLTYHDGLWKSTNNGETFETVKEIEKPRNIIISSNGDIYVGTEKGVSKSSSNSNFKKITGEISNQLINSINISSEGIVYVGTWGKGLFAINLINKLININTDGFYAYEKTYKYGGAVYNSAQKIDIKDKCVESATLDLKKITIPTTDLDLTNGQHTLVLTLKDEYKQSAILFGGDNNGQVTYKLWVKTSIDKNDIKYSTNKDDTELYSGLVSNVGNTNGADIIQTKNKNISVHQATLNSKFDDILIDYPNSYYVQGTVDDATNDFTENGSHETVSKNLSITTDGIYHLHLEDTIGNQYDSYLELGESNWKLTGTFDDQALNDKANKLNVTIDGNSASQELKQEFNGWLDNYKNIADSTFNVAVSTKGKGFNITIDNDLKGDYKSFLDHITYVDSKTQYAINQTKLNDEIIKIAEQNLNDGLDKLPQNLNINTSNVVNKSTLEHYTNWINNYQDFINKNKDKWINDIEIIASRGFATKEQENQISSHILSLDFEKYLEEIVWEDNSLLKSTSNDYQQYVKLEKLKNDTIDWVNTNMKDIDITYQNVIKNAESGLNLHGYSIDTLLNGKPLPQTKSEIDNFSDGQSYHDWLQSQANIKFRGWQLAMGFGIGIPFLLVVVAIGWIIRRKTDPRYNGITRAKKETKIRKSNFKKSIKNIKRRKT